MASPQIADLILDVIPPTMRRIRHELRTTASISLTVPQLRVIAHVFRGVETSAELAEIQGVSFAAISKMIDALVESNYLTKSYRNGNKKQFFLSLTGSGKSRYLKIREFAKAKIAQELSKSSEKEQRKVEEGLRALQQILSRWKL